MATYDYNINPTPQYGQGAFGMVPGAIGIPPNTYEQLQGAYPAFQGQLGQAGANITSELAGEVDMPSLARQAAAFGIGSGMPGSGFGGTVGLNRTEQAVQQMKRQGLQDYMGLSGLIGGMQTPQGLAASIAQQNAELGAAPNPAQAFNYQRNLYNQYRGGNSPAGGTGSYNPGIPQSTRDMSWFYEPAGGGGVSAQVPQAGGTQYDPWTDANQFDMSGNPYFDPISGDPFSTSDNQDMAWNDWSGAETDYPIMDWS